MKLKYIYFFLLPLLAGTLILSAFSSNEQNPDMSGNEGLIKFSHKFHSEQGIDCETCHAAVNSSKSLTDNLLPKMETCGSCHDVDSDDNCKLCHYEDKFEPLVQKKADNIRFNHSFHLNEQKLKCETCHKGINEVKYAENASQPFPLMQDCYSCHNDKKAPNECESCHESVAKLKPQSHKSSSFILTHKFAAKKLNADCVMCHNENNNSCQDCHDVTNVITEDNTAANFYQPYSPTNFSDKVKKQKITRVHDINYVFTHGIDAKGKTAECTSCHETQTFCANCHQSKQGDFSLGGITPISHTKPDFMRIGVGSGGGEHAILARRDIESCAACHDVQGADPTCIKCHLDSDGIQGTNPKTHPANFMKDVHGDWHDSDGAVCFNCHTNTHKAGLGFCGYCHGAK